MAENEQENSGSSQREYTAESIRVVSFPEPVRMRPGMYLGPRDSAALRAIFAVITDLWEIALMTSSGRISDHAFLAVESDGPEVVAGLSWRHSPSFEGNLSIVSIDRLFRSFGLPNAVSGLAVTSAVSRWFELDGLLCHRHLSISARDGVQEDRTEIASDYRGYNRIRCRFCLDADLIDVSRLTNDLVTGYCTCFSHERPGLVFPDSRGLHER